MLPFVMNEYYGIQRSHRQTVSHNGSKDNESRKIRHERIAAVSRAQLDHQFTFVSSPAKIRDYGEKLQGHPRKPVHKEKEMMDRIKRLLREGSMCVLATCSENKPLCSLMAYVTDDEARTLFMATLKTSRKYRNILQCPDVSVLVDTRVADHTQPNAAKALTVSGTASVLQDVVPRSLVLSRIEQTHPHLKELLAHPGAEVIAVKASSYLLLDGPLDAHLVHVPQDRHDVEG